MRTSGRALALGAAVATSMAWSCGGGGGDPAPDTTGPTVVSTSPGDGATSIPKTATLTATFSESVAAATVSTTSFSVSSAGGTVTGTVSLDGPSRTATFTPSSALISSTTYTASIAGVKDTAGNPMPSPHVWSFETSAPAAGDVDPSFGTLGMTRTDLGSAADQAMAIAIQTDDRIVVAGGSAGSFALVRYDPDGALDQTFGTGGKVTTPLGPCGGTARAVVLQPDGKIVAAGTCAFDIALVRYRIDGTLDPSFGANGVVLLTGAATDIANAIAIDSGGNIVVAGSSDLYWSATNSSDFFVARFTPAGALDTTFSGDGRVYVDFKPSSYTSGSPLSDSASGLAIQADGKLVVVGQAENTAWLDDVALALINPDGTLAGKSSTQIGNLKNNAASAVAIRPDGKIVVSALVENDYFGLLQFTTSLTLDTSFNGNGMVKTDLRNDTFSSTDHAYALLLQPDAKAIVAGMVRTAGGNPYPQDFAIARYGPTGPLDATFGAGGKIISDAGFPDDVLTGVARQSDGKIVVAGTSGGDFVVARYVP